MFEQSKEKECFVKLRLHEHDEIYRILLFCLRVVRQVCGHLLLKSQMCLKMISIITIFH